MPIAALGGLLGPILAGTLSDGFGRATPQLLFGALVGVCVLALLASPKGGGERHGHDPFLTTLRLGRRSPIVLTAVAVMFLAAVTEGVTGVLGPQQLDRNGVSASVTGIVLGVGSAAFILVSLVITRHADRVLRLNFAAAAVLILGAICVLLAAAPETIPTSAGLILRTAALGLAFTICFPLAGVGADSVGMGRGAAYAALQAAGGSGSAIGPYASGVIGESVGDWLAYSLVGGLGIVAAVWILSMQRSAKSRAGGGAMLSPMAQAQQRRDADTDAAAAAPAPASAPAGETASP
jgi:MFS family permease